MPCPETAYMTSAITTSCQPRPQPHITGTAATTASRGTPMKAASMTCAMRARRKVLGTDAIGPVRAPVVTGCAGGRIVVVGAVMRLVSSCGRPPSVAYASVTYGTVGWTCRGGEDQLTDRIGFRRLRSRAHLSASTAEVSDDH